MRKISELAAQAFLHGKNFNRDNTSVVAEKSHVNMYLFGHMIAKREYANHGISSVSVTLAGWGTPTTRERVNGLLRTLGSDSGYYQQKHCQMFDGKEVDSSEWITAQTRC